MSSTSRSAPRARAALVWRRRLRVGQTRGQRTRLRSGSAKRWSLAQAVASCVFAAGCAPAASPPVEPPPEEPQELWVGEQSGLLTVSASVDGSARSDEEARLATVSLAHASADSRAIEVRVGARAFTLSNERGVLYHVADEWKTPLSTAGEVAATRLADDATRPVSVSIVAEAECDRFGWTVESSPGGRLHTTRSERTLVLCGDGRIREWSWRDEFPAGYREIRWVSEG